MMVMMVMMVIMVMTDDGDHGDDDDHGDHCQFVLCSILAGLKYYEVTMVKVLMMFMMVTLRIRIYKYYSDDGAMWWLYY